MYRAGLSGAFLARREQLMKKLLIVQDDMQLSSIISQRLRNDGFECLAATDGEQAFAAAKQEFPDVIILDAMLPRMTGYEVCRRIRRDPQLFAVPVLILSVLADRPEIVHALEQGADDHVAKPFRFDDLLTKVRALAAMKESLKRIDTETQLPGTDAVKRQINHRLARKEKVAVCYFDILHARAFRTVHGTNQFHEVIKVAANSMRDIRESLKLYDMYLGYMGGRDFAAVTDHEHYDSYCKDLIDMFKQRVIPLYRPVERKQGYLLYTDMHGREAKAQLMGMFAGVVHNRNRRFQCARHIFEVLAHVKVKAEQNPSGSVFVDRRCSDR